MNIDYIKTKFPEWNKKTTIAYENRQYKIVGCGKKAFKVLKFEPQLELENKGSWSQVFWNYSDITVPSKAYQVIKKMENMMRG